MALMGVIIHAVGNICSFSALESPAGFKELHEGHVSRLHYLNQTNYVSLFSWQACAITCSVQSINLNAALLIIMVLKLFV